MIDGSEKRNRQLAFELQNSHVCKSAVILRCVQSVADSAVLKLFMHF